MSALYRHAFSRRFVIDFIEISVQGNAQAHAPVERKVNVRGYAQAELIN